MSQFSYVVQDARGEAISGTLEAGDENEAVAALQSKGYFILSLSSKDTKTGVRQGASSKSKKVAQQDLIFFSEQLSTLLTGGVPLVRALSLLGEHTSSQGLHEVVGAVTQDVSRGTALYKALAKHPAIFDTLWVSLVQAGEMGGQLPKVLRQIANYLTAQAELRGKIITALAYPAVLACMSGGVLAFFVIHIVPVFADIFKQFHIKLPILTQMVVSTSELIVHHLGLIIFVVVGGYMAWKSYTSTDVGKISKWNLIFGIPFFGDFIKHIMVERLLTTLSTLIESGVSILNAIAVLEGVFSSNIIFQMALNAIKVDVAAGKSISAAFRKSAVLPPLVTEMMFMGEESGKLPDMLQTMSGFYRLQIDQFTRRFTAIIDPILVVGIGGLVGVIVLAVFMPIFKMSTMGGGH